MRWDKGEANLGNILYASQVTDKPAIKWDCDFHSYYTLYMFDVEPLGPNNELLSEAKQWVIGNINKCDLTEGEIIVDYLAPTPLNGTGSHRYVFLLYKQRRKINFEEEFIRTT